MPKKEVVTKPVVSLHMKITRANGDVEERTVDGRIERKPEEKGNG